MAEWTMEDVAPVCRGGRDRDGDCPWSGCRATSTCPASCARGWEGFDDKDYGYRPIPPSPEAIERMLETMRWMQWLEVEQRHLIWMRAKHYGWKFIRSPRARPQ